MKNSFLLYTKCVAMHTDFNAEVKFALQSFSWFTWIHFI